MLVFLSFDPLAKQQEAASGGGKKGKNKKKQSKQMDILAQLANIKQAMEHLSKS